MSQSVTVHQKISGIPASEWDATGAGQNPFTTHRFLAALENSGSVGAGTGWIPAHLAARDDDGGTLRGVAPCYIKLHSQGEYIFDHAWADAYERAGGQYYPKLQCAVPFTPVTGPRLIAPDPEIRTGLLNAMAQLCTQNRLSGAHITFCTRTEAELGKAAGFMSRSTQQFHWVNDNYVSYDDFLSRLSSRKRKVLRKERQRAQAFGGTIHQLRGDEIQPAHWDAFWTFYQNTGARKWGQPYLTRSFFDCLNDTMHDDCLLVLAEYDGVPVAGALNLIGPDAIFGRYWGAVEEHPFLHFEMCYHQAIDFAIAHGLSRVEAGAQGEHKLARGYMPTETHSLHWVTDSGFRRAIDDYLTREREAVGEEIEFLRDWGPFRRG